jgi:O-antigen/teichoic acid export membrane protein
MWLLVRHYRWLRIGVSRAQRFHLARLFKPALGNVAIPLSQALGIQGMVLVVGGMLGPLAVVAFSTTRTLTRLALQLVACISYASEPEFAAMLGTGDSILITEFYGRTTRASLWISLTTIAGLAVWGPVILQRWTHGNAPLNPVLFGLLLATVLSQTLWNGALSMLKACNKHMNAAAGQLVAALFTVLLALALLSVFKTISAAGFAIFVADIAFLSFSVIQVRRVLGIDMVGAVAGAFDPRWLISRLRWPFHA